VLVMERQVVDGFRTHPWSSCAPEFKDAHLATPVSMLLFGMINWMFTWLKPDGRLGYDQMAPMVADLFFGGIHRIQIPPHEETPR